MKKIVFMLFFLALGQSVALTAHAEENSCPSILFMFDKGMGVSSAQDCLETIAKYFSLNVFSGGFSPAFLTEPTAALRKAFLEDNCDEQSDVKDQISGITDKFGGME